MAKNGTRKEVKPIRRNGGMIATTCLLSNAASRESLDSQGASPISASIGLPAHPDRNHFAFLHEGTSPDHAREDLAEAVSLLVERPALEAALAAATLRFEHDPEGSIAEQGRLRERLLALDARLRRFGRKRAATARQPLSASPVPAEEANATD